jgi:hypothetical protein
MSGRSPLNASRGAGVGFHQAARSGGALQNQPPAVANVAGLQVLGASVTQFSIDVPELAADATTDVDYTQALGIPALTLQNGATGLVVVSLTLTQQGDNVTVTFTQQLSYGGVSPQNVWTIPPNGRFAGGQVSGVARIIATAAAAAQTLTALCNAHVYGIPASNS